MPFVEWNESIKIGIESIDIEHRALISMLDRIYDSVREKKPKKELMGLFDEIVVHARVHFRNEEGYFQQTGYPDAAAHAAEHAALLDQIEKAREEYEKDPQACFGEDDAVFLRAWLLGHIEDKDKKYAEHLIRNGIR